jgi:hypothetical protein
MLPILASCAPPVGSGEQGNLTILLPGSGEGRAVVPEILDKLVYTVTFSGPRGEQRTLTTAPGAASVTLTLGWGDWTVRADASLGGLPFGSGEAGFRIADSSAQYVAVAMTSFYLTSINAVNTALESASGGLTPNGAVPLPVSLDLSTGWALLLTAIQSAGKYVALDLSACVMGPGVTEFDPDRSVSTGKDRIVSLILPNTAVSIADGTYSDPAFKHFSALKRVEGEYVETVGREAFWNCTGLTSVSLPAAKTIGTDAFLFCPSLPSIDLPMATTNGNSAFAFCTGLTSVSLPAAKTVVEAAFWFCNGLTSVSFPAAETIGNGAFQGCTALETVNLPAVTTIGREAFADTGTTESLTVSLGGTPPELGTNMFHSVSGGTKTVTVRVPGTALAVYGPTPTDTTTGNRGNAFRGKGWDGTACLTGTVNANISLTIEAETP